MLSPSVHQNFQACNFDVETLRLCRMFEQLQHQQLQQHMHATAQLQQFTTNSVSKDIYNLTPHYVPYWANDILL